MAIFFKPTLALASSSDTGRSSSDRITSDASPLFVGNALPNVTVRIFSSGVLLVQTTSNSSGEYSVVFNGTLPDGLYQLTARAVVDGAEGEVSDTLQIRVDTIAPNKPSISLDPASDTGTSSSDRITRDTTPTLTGNADPASTIEIRDNGVLIGTVFAGSDGIWEFTTPVRARGVHTFTADSFDPAGNPGGTSANLTVTIDNLPPAAAPFNLVLASDSGVAGDGITNVTRPTIQGTGDNGSLVQVFEGTTLLGQTTVANGTWSLLLPTLSPGIHNLRSVASDVAGNIAQSARQIVIDTASAAMSISLLAANDSGVAGDRITSDSTPMLIGTAEAGATVTIMRGTTVLGTATADSSRAWALQLATALPEGTNNLTATARDIAGNVSTVASLTLTIDTTAPTAPGLALAAGSDSGIAGDDRTNDATPTLGGTAEAKSTVTISRGSTVAGTVAANASGIWSFTDTERADGLVTYSAVATDAAGNTSSAASTTISIDLEAPLATRLFLAAASDTGRSQADRITRETKPTLNGITESNASVTIFEGAEKIGSVTANPAGVWSMTLPETTEGEHTYTATTADAAGNPSASTSSITIVIDLSPPDKPTIELDPVSDSGRSGDFLTKVQRPIVTGTAEPLATVELLSNGIVVGTADADATGAYRVSPAADLPDGIVGLQVRAVDAAGNRGAPSGEIKLRIDATPPAAPTIALDPSSDTGASPGDRITAATNPMLTGRTEPGISVWIFDGETLIGSTNADANGDWLFVPLEPLADGVHDFRVRACDDAWNMGPDSAPLLVTIDTAALTPTVALDPASDSGRRGDGITRVTAPTFSGTAEAGARVLVESDVGSLGFVFADSLGNWRLTPAASFGNGDHKLSVREIDVAGNISDDRTLGFVIDTAAPGIPSFSLEAGSDSGAAGDLLTNDRTFTLSGVAEAGSTVSVFDGSVLLGSAPVDSAGQWSFTPLLGLPDGNHSITASATDAAGNAGARSGATVIRIDGTVAAPGMTLDPASDTGVPGDLRTSSATPVLTGVAEAFATVTVFQDSTVVGTAIAGSDGSWSITASSSTVDGTRSFTARQTDLAGNVSALSAPLVVTIDRTKPAQPTLTLDAASDSGASSSDAYTNDTTPTLTGTAEAGSVVAIIKTVGLVDTFIGEAITGSNGVFSFTLAEGVAPGSAEGVTTRFVATARDAAGNVSLRSSSTAVTVDTGVQSSTHFEVIRPDTGRSNFDSITNDPDFDIIIHETGDSRGSTYTIFIDGVASGTVTGPGNPAFNPPGALADGSYQFAFTITDLAGNFDPTLRSERRVIVDTVAPATPTVDLITATDSGRSATDNITNSTSPRLAGVAEANAQVVVRDGDATIATVIANGSSGAWFFTIADPAEGTHAYTAEAIDVAGNSSGRSAVLNVAVDRTAPAIPTLALAPNSDTGNSSSDRITSDVTPTLTGTAEAGSDVHIIDGATLLTTIRVGSSGTFSFTPGARTAGGHTFSAAATDAAGNASNEIFLGVTIDRTAPAATTITLDSASDSGVSSGDRITNDTTPRFTGVAESRATIRLEGTLDLSTAFSTTVIADSLGFWEFTPAALDNGNLVLTATAIDDAGNASVPASIAVVIDTIATTPTIDLSASFDSGLSGTDNVTRITQPLLTGAADRGDTVTIFDAGSAIGTAVVSNSGIYTFTPATALGEGVHNLTVRASDAAGNTSALSAALSIRIDTTRPANPTLDLTPLSDTGSSNTDNITSDTTPTFTGTGEAGAQIRLSAGAAVFDTVTVGSDGTWTSTAASGFSADGAKAVTAVAIDSAGNESPAGSLSVTIDTVRPRTFALALDPASDTGASSTDRITRDNTPTITGSGSEIGSTVQILQAASGSPAGTGTVVGTAVVGADGQWSFTLPSGLADGRFQFSARATDTAGNIGASTDIGVLTDVVIDRSTATPTVSLDPISDTGIRDGITGDTTPSISGTAEAGATVTVFLDGSALGTVVSDGTFRFTPTQPIASGAHSFTVRATDVAGNNSAFSERAIFIIDTAAPGVPTVDLAAASDSGRLANDNITNDNTPAFQGRVETGVTSVVISGLPGGDQAGVVSGNDWSFTPATALPEGTRTITVRALDGAGNTSGSSSLTFTVDRTVSAPTISLSSTSDSGRSSTDGLTNDATPTVSGTAEANADVTIRDGETVLGTARANSGGSWIFTPPAGLPDGVHNLTAQATDVAGNPSSRSASIRVQVDTTPPAAPTIDLAASSDSGASSSDNLTNALSLNLTGIAEANSTVQVFRDGSSIGTVTAAANGSWSLTSNSLITGSDVFTAKAVDAAGNTSANSASLTVTIDRAAPETTIFLDQLSDTGVSFSDEITTDLTPTLRGNADAGTIITIFDGATQIGQVTAAPAGTWSFTPAVSAGTHNFFAVPTDRAGNEGEAAGITVIVDRTAPAAPTIDLSASSDSGRSSTDNNTNDNTPRFSGTAEASAQITLMIGGETIATATADASGNWVAIAGELDDGAQTIEARATDRAGNTSTKVRLAVTIDTDDPSALTPSLNALSDTGPSAGNTTGDVTPTFTLNGGSSTDRITVTLAGQSSPLLLNAPGGTTHTFTTGILPNGTATFTTTVEDLAGNRTSSERTLIIDTVTPQGPTIDLFSQDTGTSAIDNITRDTTPTFNGSARPNSTVTILRDGVSIGTTVANASSGWSFTAPALAEGTHLISVADGSANNHQVSVTIDTTAPSAPTDLRLSSGSDVGFDGDFASREQPSFTVIAPNDTRIIELLIDGLIAASRASGGGLVTIAPDQPITAGFHNVAIRVSDTAGNVSQTSVVRQLFVDLRTLTMASATDSGQSSSDNITNDTTPTFVTTAASGATVQFFANGLSIGPGLAALNGTVTFTPLVSLAEGRHGITAFDASGTPVAAGTVLDITIDRTPPAPLRLSLAGTSDTGTRGDGRTADPTPGILFAGDGSTATVELFENGTLVGSSSGFSGSISFSTPLGSGTHTFTGFAIDAAGNRSTASTINLVIDTASATAPTIAPLGLGRLHPNNGFDLATTSSARLLQGSARPGAQIQIFDAAALLGTAIASANGNWQFSTGTLAPGNHALTARDGAAVSESLKFSVVTGPARPLTAGLSTAADLGAVGDGITPFFKPTIAGTAEPFAVVSVALLTRVGLQLVGTANADDNGTWAFSFDSNGIRPDQLLSFQTFDFQAFASDLLGRQDAVAEFTIQRAGSLFVTGAGSVADAFADNTATPQFTGSAPANSTVVIEIDGAEVGRTTASAQGAWTFNVPQAAALSDGAHIIRAVQTSGALVSATSETRLIVDLAAPAPPTVDLETGLNVGSASDQRSEDPQLVLSGLAEAGSTVTVTEGFNRDAVGSARANDQGVWSLVLDAPRPSDIYQFHATARDAAGNSSTEVSRFITVSTGEPGIPVIGLVGDSGSSSTDAITNNVRPTFEGIAAPDTDIDVFAGNILIGRTRTDADGQFSVRAEFSLSDGEHLIFVGNNNPDSVGQRIVIDTAGPAAPTMSLVAADDTGTPGDGITGDSRPSFVGQVEAFSTVTIREIGPGTSVLGQVTAGADGSWSITLDDPLQAGRHDLIAQAVDLAGNRGAASAIVSIQVELIEGTGVSETLNGSAGKDTLVGHGGNDIINGGDAVDVLVGGPGADAFVFNSTTTWGDEIIDFSNGDRIEISQSALGPEFAPGLVSASRFVSGDDPVAGSANATFLYNTGTGQLSFDTDGTGSISAVTVAVLLDRASLSANDLLVV